MWEEKDKQPIKPKGLGHGIMVSDFVDEYSDLLTLTDEEFQWGKLQYPNLKQASHALLKYVAKSKGTGIAKSFLSK